MLSQMHCFKKVLILGTLFRSIEPIGMTFSLTETVHNYVKCCESDWPGLQISSYWILLPAQDPQGISHSDYVVIYSAQSTASDAPQKWVWLDKLSYHIWE